MSPVPLPTSRQGYSLSLLVHDCFDSVTFIVISPGYKAQSILSRLATSVTSNTNGNGIASYGGISHVT